MLLQKSAHPADETWSQASAIVDRAIQQVRTMSHLLHPPLLDEVGLLSALSWYVEGLTKRSGIDTSLDVQPSDFPRLAPEIETAVFRIVQEALTNVFRHSGAQKVWITLTQKEGLIVVAVLCAAGAQAGAQANSLTGIVRDSRHDVHRGFGSSIGTIQLQTPRRR